MNDKIIKLAEALFENEECKGKEFSLTLNYKRVIEKDGIYEDVQFPDDKGNIKTYTRHTGWNIPLLNEHGLNLIREELSKVKVKNFNLSIKFEGGITESVDCDNKYSPNWYSCSFVFHGEGDIEIGFDMLSDVCKSINSGDFHRYIGEKTISDYSQIVKELINLKNLLVHNGNKLLEQFNKLKNIN